MHNVTACCSADVVVSLSDHLPDTQTAFGEVDTHCSLSEAKNLKCLKTPLISHKPHHCVAHCPHKKYVFLLVLSVAFFTMQNSVCAEPNS